VSANFLFSHLAALVQVDGYLEDEEKTGGMPRRQQNYQDQQMEEMGGQTSTSQALRTTDDTPPVSPLCIRIQVHAEGITEALLFHVDLLASAIRQAVMIKDHKSFLKVHPHTFRGQVRYNRPKPPQIPIARRCEFLQHPRFAGRRVNNHPNTAQISENRRLAYPDLVIT
jgi:hypothetical protein